MDWIESRAMTAGLEDGRPTTYDVSFCERVIELGEQGQFKAQIARELGCSRKSLYLWMKVHPEFADAMEEAQFAARQERGAWQRRIPGYVYGGVWGEVVASLGLEETTWPRCGGHRGQNYLPVRSGTQAECQRPARGKPQRASRGEPFVCVCAARGCALCAGPLFPSPRSSRYVAY
jgi:hypothetical protein